VDPERPVNSDVPANTGQIITFPSRKTASIALVGLNDPTASVLSDCFHQFGVTVLKMDHDEVERFHTEKFDACALRLDDGAERILNTARNSPVNFHMIVYGIANGPKQDARLLRYGINVILEEPVDKRAALRAVRSTYLLIVHEFRRYVRIPLVTPVRLFFEGRTTTGTTEEISGGGMSLHANRLPAGLAVEVEFAMPGSPNLRMGASVRWAAAGQLGLRFDENDAGRIRIKTWIDKYLGIS
jgi:hypothetical protein